MEKMNIERPGFSGRMVRGQLQGRGAGLFLNDHTGRKRHSMRCAASGYVTIISKRGKCEASFN